jgi:uncharacterized sulfatase
MVKRAAPLLLTCAVLSCGQAALPERPNIILIIGDDHGYPYFGFLGSEIVQTPNLDRLAREGTYFANGFTTASTCRPSLMTLLTGLHPVQWDARKEQLERREVTHHGVDWIREFETLPRVLARRGYASFQGGKYWEGTYSDAGFTHGMTVREDAWLGFLGKRAGAEGLALGRTTMQPLWDFLDRHRDRPFFVWFAPELPHTPHDASREYLDRYANRDLSEASQKYYANIARFDDRLGELLDYLERNEMRESTLLIYVSDNGWQQDPQQEHDPLGGPKGKMSIYEMGFRTPIIFSWPGVLPMGGRREGLVSTVDIFTTCLDILGIEAPPDRSGRSLIPAIRDRPAAAREFIVAGQKTLRIPKGKGEPVSPRWTREQAYFYRDHEWRYVWYRDRGYSELYDMIEDEREDHDVIGQHPELARQYQQKIEDWLASMKRPYQSRPSPSTAAGRPAGS